MLRVIRNHRRAAYARPASEYEGLTIKPRGIDPERDPPARCSTPAARVLGSGARARRAHGYRNAQVTVLAPTGTIGLVMDCDTTGIEPDFALVKFKKLAGGGYFKIINQAIPPALAQLGYTREQSRGDRHPTQSATARWWAPVDQPRGPVQAKGFDDDAIQRVEKALKPSRRSTYRSRSTLGDRRGLLPRGLGFEPTEQTRRTGASTCWLASRLLGRGARGAHDWACGTMTVEGAPHLGPKHLPVFDCANRCGKQSASASSRTTRTSR